MNPQACDVLVIGLGPGGGAAAAAAAAAGLHVIAVERKREIGTPVQCAEFIPLPLSRHAQGAGVLMQRISAMNFLTGWVKLRATSGASSSLLRVFAVN